MNHAFFVTKGSKERILIYRKL